MFKTFSETFVSFAVYPTFPDRKQNWISFESAVNCSQMWHAATPGILVLMCCASSSFQYQQTRTLVQNLKAVPDSTRTGTKVCSSQDISCRTPRRPHPLLHTSHARSWSWCNIATIYYPFVGLHVPQTRCGSIFSGLPGALLQSSRRTFQSFHIDHAHFIFLTNHNSSVTPDDVIENKLWEFPNQDWENNFNAT